VIPPGEHPPALVARVVPDVTGLDKQFDYLVPDSLRAFVGPGSMVRVPLHGRRVGGWVVALGPPDPAVPLEKLVPIARWSSIGPPSEVIELAEWATTRWGSPRLRPFLVAASPPGMVKSLPVRQRSVAAGTAVESGVRRITPLTDPLPMVVEIAQAGPTLVVHPTPAAARAIARRLRKEGLRVALVPDEWAQAAAGVDVVVGSRAAVWAPCPDLRTVVVLDEHDDALQDERTPTWHARDVAIERAKRAGASCVLISPCPTATATHWAGGRVHRPSAADTASGWPFIDIVDRTDEEPWKRSLLSSPLIAQLRDAGRRVVCVINTTGRARLLACRSCRAVQRCERCDAAVGQDDGGELVCARCQTRRPLVCQRCGSGAMANVKPGVTRLREELEAAANRPVVAVTGESEELPAADVYVGTEAVLHRVRGIDVVAFLDFDAELLAPRYRAAEHAMALLVRAGRLVGPRSAGGRVMVQTFVPDHVVLKAAMLGDPGRATDTELERREVLGLPPFRALAAVEGADAEEFARATGLEFAPTPKGVLCRADTWMELGAALSTTPRPKGSRLRVEVDPPRA
jgi:primosomal protein N' (replication factor Y) (superfamily II helicase)